MHEHSYIFLMIDPRKYLMTCNNWVWIVIHFMNVTNRTQKQQMNLPGRGDHLDITSIIWLSIRSDKNANGISHVASNDFLSAE